MRGLINIKNDDIYCFRWCHVRLLNPTNIHPERIKKADQITANQLNYSGIEFPIKEKDYPLIEQVLNVLLISDEDKSHYAFIKY